MRGGPSRADYTSYEIIILQNVTKTGPARARGPDPTRIKVVFYLLPSGQYLGTICPAFIESGPSIRSILRAFLKKKSPDLTSDNEPPLTEAKILFSLFLFGGIRKPKADSEGRCV